MAKLSHIEDIELKRAQEAMQQAQAQEAQEQAQAQEAQETPTNQTQPQDDAREAASSKTAGVQGKTTAQQEAEFHGIDTSKPMGVGHRFLIILAVLVTIAAILYIVNSWVHFI